MKKYKVKSDRFPFNVILKKSDMKKIRPDEKPRKMSILFNSKDGITEVDEDIAVYISESSKMINIIGEDNEPIPETDKFEEMSWHELRAAAKDLDINCNGKKRDEILREIRLVNSVKECE